MLCVCFTLKEVTSFVSPLSIEIDVYLLSIEIDVYLLLIEIDLSMK